MPKTPNEQLLFELINSLTKSEKRSFKLFAKRSGATDQAKFIRLFDAMEGMKSYDEPAIMKKMPEVTKTQFANLKSHLYGQILASLRLSNLKHDIDIELREQLDYIRVLYKKGLYYQSLRVLNRAKNITGDYRKDLFQLALLDYEKQIRSQQVFDLKESYADELEKETQEALARFSKVQTFFTLATKMKARFVEKGMVKGEAEMNNLKALFYTSLRDVEEDELAFNEKFYFYRAYYWFSYLTYDFANCVKYAEKWVNSFRESGLDRKRKAGYLKGLNRLLQSAFRIDDVEKFNTYYALFNEFEEAEGSGITSNTAALLLKYRTLQTFNQTFLQADFAEKKGLVESLLNQVKSSESIIDNHNLTVIHYKAGVYYFALEQYTESRYYLNKLINEPGGLRSDLKGFARIISVLIDYDSGQEEHIDRKIKAAYVYIKQAENLGELQDAFLNFFKKLGDLFPQEVKKSFRDLKAQLEQLNKDPYAAKPLLYFDMLSWLDAKIENTSFAEAVKKKVAKNLR